MSPMTNPLFNTYATLFSVHDVTPSSIAPCLDEIFSMWNTEGRFYHNVENHLIPLVNRIRSLNNHDSYDELMFTALFHDVKPSEEESAEYFDKTSKMLRLNPFLSSKVYEMILDTKQPKDNLFNRLDWEILGSNMSKLIEYEHQIFKEYQNVDYKVYIEKRCEFLKNALFDPRLPKNKNILENMENLVDYVKTRTPRIGLYAGSFHPFTIGHLDVLRKAEKMFDKVIVAIGINPEKENCMELMSRKAQVQASVKFREIKTFNGLLPDFVKSLGYPVTLVRGIRDGNDLAYELNYLRTLEDISGETNMVYIPCSREYSHVSSSMVRQLEKFSPEVATRYIP